MTENNNKWPADVAADATVKITEIKTDYVITAKVARVDSDGELIINLPWEREVSTDIYPADSEYTVEVLEHPIPAVPGWYESSAYPVAEDNSPFLRSVDGTWWTFNSFGQRVAVDPRTLGRLTPMRATV